MKKNLYLVFAALILSNIAQAQKIEGMAGFIQTGYVNATNTKVLNQIYPANPAGFSNNYFLLGAEVFYRKNRNIIIGEWQFGLQKTYSFDKEHAGAVYEAVIGKYGWILKEEKDFWLYPSIGAGTSIISLSSYTTNDGNKDNKTTQTLGSPSFDIGMNADFLLSRATWKGNYHLGWMIDIKVGYRLSLKSNNWKVDDTSEKADDMPSYANNAFYITLSLGGGSFDKK